MSKRSRLAYREITPADIPALFDVRTRTRENVYTLDQLQRLGITPASVADKLAATFKGWLCAERDRVVAFCIADRATGELWVIAVLPEYEGRGIGDRLMSFAEAWLWASGCTRAWLTTDRDTSLRAYGFYRQRHWNDWKLEDGLRWMELFPANAIRPLATTSGVRAHYSSDAIEAKLLAALRAAGLDPDRRLTPDELAPLDHFHTGGLRASHELAALAQIGATDRVLDIGAGLAGPARMLAATNGCRVDCVDLSADYCAGATLLNRLTGLGERIGVYLGSALALPFADGTFDVVWMQNVGMNVADKRTLYGEIRRVLKEGGRFAFQEMAAGNAPASHFPLPWATDPAASFLVSVDVMRASLAECGLSVEVLEDTSEDHLRRTAQAAPVAPGQLGLAAFVDDLARKAANARRCLEEGQIRLVRGVFRAR